ncbi:MAG: DUF2191 domain-containing protein [Deltaproteobacteria bacterium]|nr:DUF2191 domain-containing protein [Deltaproteobacteria bacterium]
MRTSVDIPDNLLRRIKGLARRRGTTLRELIIQGLRDALTREAATARGYRLEECAVGEGGLIEGLTDSDWDEVRARIYEGRGG